MDVLHGKFNPIEGTETRIKLLYNCLKEPYIFSVSNVPSTSCHGKILLRN